jgi:hypothetical protein
MAENSDRKSNKKNWTGELIENIVYKIQHDLIVPIIGPGIFFVKEGANTISVQEYIVRELLRTKIPTQFTDDNVQQCSTGGIKGMTKLSQLFDKNGLTLSNQLHSLFKKKEFTSRISIHKSVLQFLQNGQFPLIISACRFNLLNQWLKPHGKNYRTVVYQKGQKPEQDILLRSNMNELEMPTIIHIFGEYSETPKLSGVVTEDDFLAFLHYLHDSFSRPKSLISYLGNNKFVFTLGCDIPDWTFRFMLFSLKEHEGQLKDESGKSDNFVGGVLVKPMDEDFRGFLSNNNYFPSDLIDDFLKDINDKLNPKNKTKVFLSLSSEEYDTIGVTLYRTLLAKFDVWFFKYDGDSLHYWESIKQGLQDSEFILPVITMRSINKIYRYRPTEITHDANPGLIEEWEMAFEQQIKCCPLYVECKEGDLKEAIDGSQCMHLRDFFFSDPGNAGLVVDLEPSDVDKVYRHIIK